MAPTEEEIKTAYNTLIETIEENFQFLDGERKHSVKAISSANAVITVTKGDDTTETLTIDNVANAAHANTAASATSAENAASATKAAQDANGNVINTTYATKAEVSAIPKFAVKVVTELPSADISTTTIYLVKTGSEDKNLYTEYIYVDSKWEKLGEQKLDLSGYVPASRKVNNKALSGDITLNATDVGAAAASHNQASSTITALTGYTIAAAASAIAATDSLNSALGKLQKSIDGKQAAGSYLTKITAGTGISVSGNTITNAGVRSVVTGTTNGTITVDTNGSTKEISVKGLGTAAYTEAAAYSASNHTHTAANVGAYTKDEVNTLLLTIINGANITALNQEE